MKGVLFVALVAAAVGALLPGEAEAARLTFRVRRSSMPTPHYLLLKTDPRRNNGPNYFVHPPYHK